MILEGKVQADDGVKDFKKDTGEVIQYRHLVVNELGNANLVKVAVPFDYKAPALGQDIKIKVYSEKAKLAK